MLPWIIVIFLALYVLGLFSLAWRFYQQGKKMPYKPKQPVSPTSNKIYIICPVRKLTEEEKNKILNYVKELEKQGHTVKCPFRDTNQTDKIGLHIVEEHTQDILWADQIHIWWNPTSEGSIWDIAQSYLAMRLMTKKMVLINPEDIELTPDKSFTNVVVAICLDLHPDSTIDDLKQGLDNYLIKQRKAR